jgi:hypothetical protein
LEHWERAPPCRPQESLEHHHKSFLLSMKGV